MQLPDYQGGSIVNLMASLQAGLGGSEHAYAPLTLLPVDSVRAHRQVLLLVIDGLGYNTLRAHPEAACLNAHLAGPITSTFPPTTASAIPTFLTGDAPQQHGLTGWHMYFRELGSVLAVLPGRARYGGVGLSDAGVDPATLLEPRPFANKIDVPAYTVSPVAIANSDFNRTFLGRAQLIAYRDLDDMLSRCVALLQSPGTKYLYAYWSELDGLGHHHGIGSGPVREHLLQLDRAFEALLERLRGTETLVLAVADHGQIDPLAGHRMELDAHPAMAACLSLPLCGEARAVYCYLRPGGEVAFDDYVTRKLSGIADCRVSGELLDGGWYGLGQPHPRLAERIGDRVLIMHDDYVLRDWLAHERRFQMVGVHGGLHDDELYVPLIAASLQ